MANIQNNQILYTASNKLTETTNSSSYGLHTNAFNVSITSHTFSNGNGVIEFDGTLTSIGYRAFWGCSDLISVTLPDSVTTLGDMSFCYCQNLETFTVPVGVTSISSSTLSGCDNLVSIKVDSGNQTYDSRDNCNAIIETATNTLVVGCKTTVIPNTVTAIGNNAFENCNYLTSITIPSSVISIGNRSFSTASLESVTFEAPSHLTTIGNEAFSAFNKLTTITIPDSVTTIGNYAFGGSALQSVTLSNNLTSIPDSCFNNCSKLKNIVIPSSVTSIGNSAFYMCSSLKNITIPSSVTTISDYAFYGCDGMERYYFRSTTPPTIGRSRVFFDSGCPIYVPNDSVNAYKSAQNWSSYSSRIIGYNIQNTKISYTALSKLPETTSIGLEGLHINAFNATIISHTFSNGDGLIEFDDDVTTIGDYAFYNSSELTSITIPDGVTSIGNHAFDICILLDSINLANVTTIGELAFSGCESLSTANLRNATLLGTVAFGTCASLQNIILSDRLTNIPDGCFNNCISLETLEIPNTVKSIGNDAFFNDTSLKKITIPSSVTSIGDKAFEYCTGMEGYYFDSTTPPTIGTDVFANDSGCYIYVPNDSVNTYKTAKNWVTWKDRIYSNRHQTPKPTISPSSGIYIGDNLTISISSTAISGTTYYTTDGSTPTSGSTEYTAPFQITTSGTTDVKAISYSDYYTNKASVVATNTYELYNSGVIVKIDPPSSSIPTTETHVDLPVTINATGYTGNYIEIYYTTNGTTPTTNSTRYTGTFNLGIDYGHSKYVKALAVTTHGGTTYTATDTAVYTLQNRTKTPTVLPQSGDYHEGFILDITYPNGSDVYYTLDGSTPTSGSTKYTEQIYIDSNTVFKAIAYDVNNDEPYSEVVHRNYTFSDPTKSHKAPRNEDNFNGIYVKDVDYSGSTQSILDEADVTWGYRIDNADENLGEYGTRCHVNDTSILIHVEFTHGGKDYSLDKEIPVTCIVQDAQYMADILDIIQGSAIVTLNNTLDVSIRAKVTHTSESQTSSIVDLSNFTLSGTSTNGNFTCRKEGSYFVYDDTLTNDYKGSTHPANDITLTLINNNTQQQLSTLVIPVTFAAGSIFDVKDDAIRMAVASSKTYTDSGITYVNNRITDVEVNISGLTSNVSSITTNLSGVTYDVSQIEQRCDRIETKVTNMSGDMVTHSEIIQVATGITANVYNELNERTGIDIYNGTITLDADYTYITGNLMLSGATDGISFSDASGNTKISLSTDLLPNLEQFDMGAITRKRGGATQQIDTIQQSITTNYTDVQLGQYSKGQTIQIDYIVFKAYFIDAPFDERVDTMTYIISIKQNSTVIGTHSGSCTRTYEGMDEFTTGLMSTTATGNGDVTIDMSITCTNKSTAEPKTGRWQTSYNILYQKVEVNQTTIRLNGLATFQDTTHYAWLGPDQTAFRQGESTLRLKNGRIERTPISSEGGITSSNFADVSTVVPFRIVNVLTYSASTQNDGLIIFSTVLGETDSAQRTLYLGNPSECQGKILYVKNVVGSNTKVIMSSDAYRQDLLIPCNSASEVTEISIGANSSMFISDGSDWIQFHCA